jgi:stress response protein SCP2
MTPLRDRVVWDSTLDCHLSWDSEDLPVDTTAILYDPVATILDAAYFNQTSSLDNSLELRTTNSSSQNLSIHCQNICTEVQTIALVLHASKVGDFGNIAQVRFTVKRRGVPLFSYDIPCKGEHTAFILGVFHRDFENAEQWYFQVGSSS